MELIEHPPLQRSSNSSVRSGHRHNFSALDGALRLKPVVFVELLVSTQINSFSQSMSSSHLCRNSKSENCHVLNIHSGLGGQRLHKLYLRYNCGSRSIIKVIEFILLSYRRIVCFISHCHTHTHTPQSQERAS